MITQREVVRKLNEFVSISENTFRRYVYMLLDVADDDTLVNLVQGKNVPWGIRVYAYRVLEKRYKNNHVVNNSVEHKDSIDN